MQLKFWKKKKEYTFEDKAKFLIYFHDYLDKGNLLPYELTVAQSLADFYFQHWVIEKDGVTFNDEELHTLVMVIKYSNADPPTQDAIIIPLNEKYFPYSRTTH